MLTAECLFSWLAALFSLIWAYPWARLLLDLAPLAPGKRGAGGEGLLTLLLTPALSVGALAWGVLMLSALSGGPASFWAITGTCLLISATGWVLLLRRQKSQPPRRQDRQEVTIVVRHAAFAAALVVATLAALTLFNAAAWPFFEDDAVQLYAPMAYRFAQTGQFWGAGAYDAYPPLIPLAFAYPQLATGTPNEYAARFVGAALALGVIGGAYALAKDLFGRETGQAATVLVATAPMLLHWAATGYTDLPAGMYYALAALFAWRLFAAPHPVYALLAGGMAGLAAFTKNGALLIVGSLAGWVVYSWWAGPHPKSLSLRERDSLLLPVLRGNSLTFPLTMRERGEGGEGGGHPITLRHAVLLAAAFLIVAGPWYAHTLRTFGVLVPPTGWIDRADRSLLTLLDPALAVSHLSLGGLLGMIGLAGMLWWVWRTRPRFEPRAVLLAGFTLPFLLVWWWFFSYDLRFLLLVWAPFGVMGAWALAEMFRRLPSGRRNLALRLLPLALLALAIPAAWMAVDHKTELLRDPLMSGEERHRVQLGPRYDAVVWLRDHASPGARVVVTDYFLFYPAMQAGFTVEYWPTVGEELGYFHYWVLAPGVDLPESDLDLRLVYEAGGYRVYAVSGVE